MTHVYLVEVGTGCQRQLLRPAYPTLVAAQQVWPAPTWQEDVLECGLRTWQSGDRLAQVLIRELDVAEE